MEIILLNSIYKKLDRIRDQRPETRDQKLHLRYTWSLVSGLWSLISGLWSLEILACDNIKSTPIITFSVPTYERNITQDSLTGVYGNVIAHMKNDYELGIDFKPIKDGFCVYLKTLDVSFGFDKFDIKIDKKFAPSSTMFNHVLAHEDEHIKMYLKIINDNKTKINNAINIAGNSVKPMFVENLNDIGIVMDKYYYEITNHTQIKMIQQKIETLKSVENNKIDNR